MIEIKMYSNEHCGACNMMKPELKMLEQTVKTFRLIELNAADEEVKKELRAEGVSALPYIKIIKDGQIHKLVGWQPTEKIKMILEM